MTSSRPAFRRAVEESRAKLASAREEMSRAHSEGVPAATVCDEWSRICTSVLEQLSADAHEVTPRPSEQYALVAHGGFGRFELAPYSDIDLMLLHDGRSSQDWAPFAKRLSQAIFDVGMDLGFSVRSIADCFAESQRDVRVLTSLTESRLFAGDAAFFRDYWNRFRRFCKRNTARLVGEAWNARRAERRQYGDTVYLLEPNVKRSEGGLRDIHCIRWLGAIRGGTTDFRQLKQKGLLSAEDLRELTQAQEFLMWLRNELHVQAGRAQDLLSRSEQLRIAEGRGYPDSSSERPVEAFMREYFHHTRAVRDAARHFYEAVRPRSRSLAIFEPVISHRATPDYLVGPVHIRARPTALKRLTDDLAEVLRLMDLANWYNRRIDHRTWQAIRAAVKARDDLDLSPTAAKRFLSLMSHPARLGPLLRRLHELRVLELFVAGLRHAWCLVQFNEYHKYTVDEHCILAVQQATEFGERNDELGEAYRNLQPKYLLHLALLLHDLGKGFPRDHSEVGGELAAETGRRLGLSSRDTAMLRTLVEKHLLMSHLAQQHNVYDESTWLRLAREIGSPFVLQMLYVLTCADLAAVGPGVLTDWKLRLITDLYLQTREHLTTEADEPPAVARIQEKAELVRGALAEHSDAERLLAQLERVPRQLMISEPAEEIIDLMARLAAKNERDVAAWGAYDDQRATVTYTIMAPADMVPGPFHRLTGALASCALQVLAADIFTLPGGVLLDRFVVEDPDFEGAPPPARIHEVCDKLTASLTEPSEQPPAFRRLWQSAEPMAPLRDLPPRVRFDNATSPEATIISVFAYDRRGLLYDLSKTLFSLGLSVQSAKIGTHLDQVTDVFYVTDSVNEKITEEAQLEDIRAAILEAVDNQQSG